jgi:hypothetical protein
VIRSDIMIVLARHPVHTEDCQWGVGGPIVHNVPFLAVEEERRSVPDFGHGATGFYIFSATDHQG